MAILILGNCSSIQEHTGPLVTGCVIDAKNYGYRCADSLDAHFFLSFLEVDHFECFAPWDFETFLKACQRNEKGTFVQDVSCLVFKDHRMCVYEDDTLDLQDMDNYFCMSQRDLKRILDRCDNVLMNAEI